MDLYIFPCAVAKNIGLGVKARKWAVSDIDSASMKARFTKSLKMLRGSRGLLYCTEPRNQYFSVPFRTLTQPKSPGETISDVWPTTWALPFEIEPLGPSYRTESLDVAKRAWLLYREVKSITDVTPVGGRFAFNACQISEAAWEEIVRILGYKDGDVRE